jgi:hypothetical protein
MPGIAGGRNANAIAPGICDSWPFSDARIPWNPVSAVVRSSHGSSETKKKAL